MEFGISPLDADKMSLLQVLEMYHKLPKNGSQGMSETQMSAALDKLREMNLPDVRV